MRIKLLLLLLIFFFSGNSCSALTEDDLMKREKIRYAIKEELLSPYDIPFATYVSLEMWEEIDSILEKSHQNMTRYRLPKIYYSRPYVVDGKIWVFENNPGSSREIHVFHGDSLKFSETLQNNDFSVYEGGIRAVSGNRVISGGSDRDVDTAVVWDVKENEVTSLKLKEGHYIGSIATDENHLYIGSCGGMVNAWQMPDFSFAGSYASSEEANSSWEKFNRKPCITALLPMNDRLMGAGEKEFFIWKLETGKLIKKYGKKLPGSLVFFYQNFVIEYKENRVLIRSIPDGRIIQELKTEAAINDLIVTSEELLPDQAGPVMILSLRHNKGLCFYDFESLELLRKTDFKGESLTVFRHQIFATDDRYVYKYNIRYRISEACRNFLENIRPEELELTENLYKELLQRSLLYPDVIDTDALASRFLQEYGLEIHHALRYGRIRQTEGQAQEGPDAEGAFPASGGKERFGFRLVYEIGNHSDKGLFLTTVFRWSGEYGRRSDKEQDGSALQEDFFIPPGKGKITGMISVGEKEPARLQVYPLHIAVAEPSLYEGLKTALGKENKDMAIIDRYLKDQRFRHWHPALKLRKNEIADPQEKDSFLLRILQ